MKVGRRATSKKATNPSKNNSTKTVAIICIIVVAAALILWVYRLGKEAQETVTVLMWNQDIYKNQVITSDMLTQYDMQYAEFEKYSIENSNGTKTRRIFLADEAGSVVNTFAAYPLHKDTVAFVRDVVTSRTDNSDSVLYSFPGKDIVALDVGTNALGNFKTFLQPGDRVNITAIFTLEQDAINEDTGEKEKITAIKEEQFLTDVLIADVLNGDGASVLDIYASYNDRTVTEQALLDASDTFKKSVEPKTLLIALTPEEKSRYFEYTKKQDAEFKMSLPQRVK